MTLGSRTVPAFALFAMLVACTACNDAPGYPRPGEEVPRPDKIVDFPTLYKENCSGCHGDNGRGGAAIALNNPAYLAVAGVDNIRAAAAKGMAGTLMPAFAASSGGMLTEVQVDAIVQGMIHDWGKTSALNGVALPPYAAAAPGDPAHGQAAYVAACARCHGNDGTGIKSSSSAQPHSIVDPSYLALVSDQSLRSIVIAGHPDPTTPDWRTYISGRALAPQEITDIVAWLAQHREPGTARPILNPHVSASDPAASQPGRKEAQ